MNNFTAAVDAAHAFTESGNAPYKKNQKSVEVNPGLWKFILNAWLAPYAGYAGPFTEH